MDLSGEDASFEEVALPGGCCALTAREAGATDLEGFQPCPPSYLRVGLAAVSKGRLQSVRQFLGPGSTVCREMLRKPGTNGF